MSDRGIQSLSHTMSRLHKPFGQAFCLFTLTLALTFVDRILRTGPGNRQSRHIGRYRFIQSHQGVGTAIHRLLLSKSLACAPPPAQNGAPLRWWSSHQRAVIDPDEWRLLSPQSVRRGGAQSPAGRGAQKNDQRRVRAPKIV